MKKPVNLVLGICAIVLLYLCYLSIMGPIEFKEEFERREAAVRERLIQIRTAEEEYKKTHEDEYCDSMPLLIEFIKNGRTYEVLKEGDLTDEQVENGMTEREAVHLGLIRRDTIWTSIADGIFGKGFNADSIAYIPYGNGAKFELEKFLYYNSKSETSMWLMECRAPFETYLSDMDSREVTNKIKDAEERMVYPGLKFGDLTSPNNNAGSWE